MTSGWTASRRKQIEVAIWGWFLESDPAFGILYVCSLGGSETDVVHFFVGIAALFEYPLCSNY